MQYDKECLYDVEWQRLRISLLGSWTSMDSCKACLMKLEAYIASSGDIDSDAKGDLPEREWRCLNLVNAVLLGFGNKEAFKAQAIMIREWRAAVMEYRNDLPDKEWDWDKVQRELYAWRCSKDGLGEMIELRRNLEGRVKTSLRRNGHTRNRPELMKFMDMLKAQIHNAVYTEPLK